MSQFARERAGAWLSGPPPDGLTPKVVYLACSLHFSREAAMNSGDEDPLN